jgi:hypothetical protein
VPDHDGTTVFTLADINLATTLIEPWELSRSDDGDIRPGDRRFPAVGEWLARCTSRQSWERVGTLP